MKLTPIASNMTEVELNDGRCVLFSYKTPVAAHIPGEGFIRTSKRWSVTTSKHINKWLTANGSGKAREVEQAELDAMGAQ